MYKVLISNQADKFLKSKKIDKKVKEKIISSALELEKNGLKANLNIKKLTSENEFFRFRVGDFRVIFKVEEKKLIILIVLIKHRREVYKNI